ncbi:MAG: hypothetical protein ACSLFN_09455 [Candidatus Limnocylindrales bacterium]
MTVLGHDMTRDADALKPRIGVSLQTAALYPKLTVTELSSGTLAYQRSS